MQLDRVRRDPGLAVVEVEEGDPRNASAEPDMAPGQAHLATPQRGCVPVARRLAGPPTWMPRGSIAGLTSQERFSRGRDGPVTRDCERFIPCG